MKNQLLIFGDIKISIVLFLIFALFCALATFIESAYNTPTAWAMIYGTSWFGFLQLLLGINLFVALFKYKMFNKKKLPLFIFHISFLFILLGSAMTRYMGFEGNLHIRENDKNNIIETSKSYVYIATLKDDKVYSAAKSEYIATLPFANHFSFDLLLPDDKINITYKNLILDAKEVYKEDSNSSALLSLMISQNNNAKELIFQAGDIENINGINIAFLNDDVPSPYIKIDKDLKLSADFDLKFMSMSDGKEGILKSLNKVDAKDQRLYSFNDINLVVKFASLHGKKTLEGINTPKDESFFTWFATSWIELGRNALIAIFGEPKYWNNSLLNNFKDFAQSTKYMPTQLSDNAINALELQLNYKGEKKNIFLVEYASPIRIDIAGEPFFLRWGPKGIEMPFEMYLKDFELLRYPGSMSPMSYASYVEIDNKNEKFDYKIFMNNVLDYEGYRFYQSSYDQDEQGTILSVNKDPGKIPTYIGYFLLTLGMFLNILNPHSRFRNLARLINQDALKKTTIALFLALCIFNTQNIYAKEPIKVDENHAQELASLIVQKPDGRMVPFNTLAIEVLEKIYKDTKYQNQSAEATIISMIFDGSAWYDKKVIFMPTSKLINEEISKILGITPSAYASFEDFFTKEHYKLQKYVENANRKNPNRRSVFDKEIIKLDERVNILNLIFSGEIFKFIPLQNSSNNQWISPYQAFVGLKDKEGDEVRNLLETYFNAVSNSIVHNNWQSAHTALNEIKNYQDKYGHEVMPSANKISTEIFFNKSEIFVNLAPLYLFAGFLLLIIVFIKMLMPKIRIDFVFKCVYVFNIFAFFIHTLGLALRWYIAGRAPWSNAYESMVYIAWALSLSGIFFSRKSPIALSLTSILAGVTLGVAHLSQMDPQITNLVPVLQSYWLTIHVSVITASYGFLGLCALLGIFVLVLLTMLKNNGKHNENILRNITEATRINEMAMILGLCLLTVGNFLGAIWANESWGRYWSWDSKETWALISILVYAAILHIRLVPKWANQYTFAVCSMFAYWAIIMTYFGVNYFLTGMHSYAAGDSVNIPSYVYWGFLSMVALSLLSYFKKSYAKKL
ncbi:c-type cytochrome biogenesis protein CcsB [Campylobacter peloridis]|uniref:c-type cytochrome biogenesis protein CcsB n=1 Tax=Campylobacter peloridis TaxID=488546 RepID=UPI001C73698E|nr:c-type cytochrome biogenesis protein CcsB [Campylobacter peloridis]MBX1886564.1 c-type cytochrome biogenesis protein CcsB [Campylobacter peloridis]MBX2079539.1 c-type cytochrome biogenesis protein CcsB [Campylobacter peloridis]